MAGIVYWRNRPLSDDRHAVTVRSDTRMALPLQDGTGCTRVVPCLAHAAISRKLCSLESSVSNVAECVWHFSWTEDDRAGSTYDGGIAQPKLANARYNVNVSSSQVCAWTACATLCHGSVVLRPPVRQVVTPGQWWPSIAGSATRSARLVPMLRPRGLLGILVSVTGLRPARHQPHRVAAYGQPHLSRRHTILPHRTLLDQTRCSVPGGPSH